MKSRTTEIVHGWEFGWNQYESRERPALTPNEREAITWYPATVPGNAQDELRRLGLLGDPHFADNADHYRWCEEVDFWYRCSLTAPALETGERLILDFGGLDTFATIWIDGQKVGTHANMFTPFSVDVTGYLAEDTESELLIRFGAAAFESGYTDRDPNNHPPLQRTRTRRAQITYGWDIGPRLLATGPWRPVTLSVISRGRILHAGARTISANEDVAQVELVATVEWHGRPGTADISFSWDDGQADTAVLVRKGVNDVVVPVAIGQPRIWWPNGMGSQPLYKLHTTLTGDDETLLDESVDHFGVCEVTLLEEPRPDGHRGFRFTVNQQDYFAKGMNWTPHEAFFGTITAERTESLVKMAADANINMLRVWGGGIYEDDGFWDACDRHGILVWQDFMFACSLYPQDQGFLNAVKTEASTVIRASRGRVSLAAWCGDNEIDVLCGVESGTLISRRTLKDAAAELDGNRPYIVSSPFSEPGLEPNDPTSGDCHMWRHTIPHDDSFYTAKSANFVSEIGRISVPDRETIDLYLPPDAQWPPTHPLWFYHASDTNRSRRYRSIKDVLAAVKNCGYDEPQNLQEFIDITQDIQADAYGFWIRHFGGDPQCWGLLLWNLCDIWPQTSDSVISYDLRPKKAYFSVRDAYGNLAR